MKICAAKILGLCVEKESNKRTTEKVFETVPNQRILAEKMLDLEK